MVTDSSTLRQKYRQSVKRALPKKIKPFKLEPPYRFEVTLRKTQTVDMAFRISGVAKKDDATVSFEVDEHITGYRTFRGGWVIAPANYLVRKPC